MNKAISSVLLAASLTVGMSASAAKLDYDFSGADNIQDVLSFEQSGANVNVFGWYNSSMTSQDVWSQGSVSQNASGLGVSFGDSSVSKENNPFRFDDVDTDEGMLFEFDREVTLNSITFSNFDANSGDSALIFTIGTNEYTVDLSGDFADTNDVGLFTVSGDAANEVYTFQFNTPLSASQRFGLSVDSLGSNSASFNILGMSVDAAMPSSSVPEPTSLGLLGIGLLALGMRRKLAA